MGSSLEILKKGIRAESEEEIREEIRAQVLPIRNCASGGHSVVPGKQDKFLCIYERSAGDKQSQSRKRND